METVAPSLGSPLDLQRSADCAVQVEEMNECPPPENSVSEGSPAAQSANVTQYSCAICCAQFGAAVALQEHAMKHADDMNSSCRCDICNKTFVHETYLKAHVATHIEIRPHTCKVCHKGFKNASHLKSHESVHTGVKPYCCGVCSKAFSKASSLRRHQVIHERLNQVTCAVCGKQFFNQEYLREHLALHFLPASDAQCATYASRICDLSSLSASALPVASKMEVIHTQSCVPSGVCQ